MKAKFTIYGPPRGKQRPRHMKNGHTYTPDETIEYENLVKVEYRRQCRGIRFDKQVPLDVRITAYYPIPKSVSKKKHALMLQHRVRPVVKPDFDNLGKIVCDSLNQIAFYDDSQICDCQIRKFYSEEPRVVVTIQEASTSF